MEITACSNLANILASAAERFPNEIAIQSDTNEYPFARVQAAVIAFARRLQQLGFGRKSRIAMLASNCPAFSVAYFAGLWIGGTVVPINPLLSDHEIKSVLAHCNPGALIVEQNQTSRLQPWIKDFEIQVSELASDPLTVQSELGEAENGSLANEAWFKPVDLNENNTAVILYTSGSTGRPKGVELTHRNLYLNAKSVSEEKFSTDRESHILGPGEVGLAALPLSHSFGQTNLQNGMWFHGGAVVYQNRFDAKESLGLIQKHRVTFFAGVPTMYVDLNSTAKSLGLSGGPLKYCVCGGAALSASLKDEFGKRFGTVIQESYGLTETSPMISCQKIDRATKTGSVGKPIEGVELKLMNRHECEVPHGEPGEIRVRGHNVFRRYYGEPEMTEHAFSDGWFRTGDIGVLDDDGELRIVDRTKEVINSGGYSIYPQEIEQALLESDWVDEAIVVGVPDEKYGECVKAFLKLSEVFDEACGGKLHRNSTSVLAEIKSACKKKLASYKCPRAFEIVEEFPRGATGKIDRKQLK